MKITLCLPAILDEKLISKTTETIRKNIINCNPDVEFEILVNIDNYKRPTYEGDLESVEKVYESTFRNESNVKRLLINKTGGRLGLNLAYKFLVEQFYESDSEFCVFFDDDHFIINPVNISDFYQEMKNDDLMVHLSCGKKERDKSFSYENPFLENNVILEKEETVVFSNKRNFYTLPGTFLCRSQAKLVLEKVNFSSHKIIEDIVPDQFYEGKVLCTAFSNGPDLAYLQPPWVVDLKYHYAYDAERAYTGINGADLKDYM
jgi:hypothetical protein